ncbi:hypothetical protein ACI8AC_15240 [Geodermatophilus sp. SYSU D00758]
MEIHRSEAGWQIAARWWGYADDPPGEVPGPREVLIQPAQDIRPEVLRRGVTTGVMRRLERHLGNMAAEFAEKRGEQADREYVETLAAALAELPEGPRSAPDVNTYYDALLHLFETVAATHREPVNVLAKAMGIPRSTLNNRLVTARRLRNRKYRGRDAG